MLVTAIKMYRKFRIVNLAVRSAVQLHHSVRPADRYPCPLKDACSATGLSEAQQMGLRALPGILGRMSLCGGTDESPHCRPASGTGFCDVAASATDNLPHYRGWCH